MGTRISKVRRTGSGKYEATVYEVGAKTLRPVLVVHGSKALVSRAASLLPAAATDVVDVAKAPALESGTFKTAITDERDTALNLGQRRNPARRRRT